MANRTLAAIVGALLSCGGCTTLTVTKISPDDTTTKGIRYSLPRLVLKATPAPDGSVIVEEQYLPDADNTFAVSGESIFAAHTLNVQVDRGLLKKVEWKPDSGAVLSEAVTQGNALAGDRFKADAEKAKSQETALATALKALADAELTVTRARIKLEAIANDANATPAELRNAGIEYDQAIAARDAAQEALDQFLGKADKSSNVAPAGSNPAQPLNEASTPPAAPMAGATTKKADVPRIPGPILYALEDSGSPMSPSLTLKAVGDYKAPPNATLIVIDPDHRQQPSYRALLGKEPKPVADVAFFPRGLKVVRANAQGQRRLMITASATLAATKDFDLVPVDPSTLVANGQVRKLNTVSLDSAVRITVDLSGVGPGTYELRIHAVRDGSKMDAEGKLNVKIE